MDDNNYSDLENDSFAYAGGNISEERKAKVGNDVYYYEEDEEYQPPSDDNSLAVTSLSTGIGSMFCYCCSCFRYLALIAAIVAIVTGIIALNKRENKAMAIIGIITGSLSVIAFVIMIIFSILNVGLNLMGPMLFNGTNYQYYGF